MLVIIVICISLLLAYSVEISSSTTRIPSVLFLLALGYSINQACIYFEMEAPSIENLLPSLGTVGLILIVLEGSLELELKKEKIQIFKKSSIIAIIPMILSILLIALIFFLIHQEEFLKCILNSIPLCIISSAIAIPASKYLKKTNKEFVIYESSLSDILGVLLFNFFLVNHWLTFNSLTWFIGQIVTVIFISAVATIVLAYMLKQIQHKIKFLPILILIVLIYAISKELHLPGLIFVLIFGLFLGNLDEFKHISFINNLHPEVLNREVHKFKDLITEFTFLIRSIFFLLFGFQIENKDLLNMNAMVIAVMSIIIIYTCRIIFLNRLKIQPQPLLYIAPRGLISILLFLSIPQMDLLPIMNRALITQIIVLSCLVMMFGMLAQNKPSENKLTQI